MTANAGTPAPVEVTGVTFRYGGHSSLPPVLDDVSLTVEPYDFLGIIGPNGGGKTTLLRIMLGLVRPEQGQVRVFGDTAKRGRRRIGYVPQRASIDEMAPASVMDVVLTGRLGRARWGHRFTRADREAAVRALERTRTTDFAHTSIGSLSGGQRQRVLIARALAGEAAVLLLDEPTAGVDVHMEEGLTALLTELNEQMPIVIVSHDIGFVSSSLKRVACLNRTLTCHAAHEIAEDVIGEMYHGHVRAVHHDERCPATEPTGSNKETAP